MATEKKTDDATQPERLRTDWPLCEKDEQSRSVENYRKLQEQAAKRWGDLHAQVDNKPTVKPISRS